MPFLAPADKGRCRRRTAGKVQMQIAAQCLPSLLARCIDSSVAQLREGKGTLQLPVLLFQLKMEFVTSQGHALFS